MISAPQPGDVSEVTEQSLGNQAPTPGPSPGASEMEENSNHVNEILTPNDDLSQHNPAMAQPTLDKVVKVVIAEVPQTEGEQHGEADELVEDTTANTGKNMILKKSSYVLHMYFICVFSVFSLHSVNESEFILTDFHL